MELIQLGEKTYYIKNPTNIGVYRVGENEVFLIDAGNDKDAGKKILKLDPAVMASPFITTIVDALSLLVYFLFATMLLGI